MKVVSVVFLADFFDKMNPSSRFPLAEALVVEVASMVEVASTVEVVLTMVITSGQMQRRLSLKKLPSAKKERS